MPRDSAFRTEPSLQADQARTADLRPPFVHRNLDCWREFGCLADASVGYAYVLSGIKVRVVREAEELGLILEPLCQ